MTSYMKDYKKLITDSSTDLHALRREIQFACDSKKITPIKTYALLRQISNRLAKDEDSDKIKLLKEKIESYLYNVPNKIAYDFAVEESYTRNDTKDMHYVLKVALDTRTVMDKLSQQMILNSVTDIVESLDMTVTNFETSVSEKSLYNASYFEFAMNIDFLEHDAKLTYNERLEQKKLAQKAKQKEYNDKARRMKQEQNAKNAALSDAIYMIQHAQTIEELDALDYPDEAYPEYARRLAELTMSEVAQDLVNQLISYTKSRNASSIMDFVTRANRMYMNDEITTKEKHLLSSLLSHYFGSNFKLMKDSSVNDSLYMDVAKAINHALEEYESQGYLGNIAKIKRVDGNNYRVSIDLGFSKTVPDTKTVLDKLKQALETVYESAEVASSSKKVLTSGQPELNVEMDVVQSESKVAARNEEERKRQEAINSARLKEKLAKEEEQRKQNALREQAKLEVVRMKDRLANAETHAALDKLFEKIEDMYEDGKMTEEQFDELQAIYKEADEILRMRPADQSLKFKVKYTPLIKRTMNGADLVKFEKQLGEALSDDKIDEATYKQLKDLIEQQRKSILSYDSLTLDIKPRKGEKKKDFIARFMSETAKEYPDKKQRAAVAYSYWKRHHKKDSLNEDDILDYVYANVDLKDKTITLYEQKDVDDWKAYDVLDADDEFNVDIDENGEITLTAHFRSEDNEKDIEASVNLHDYDEDLPTIVKRLQEQIDEKCDSAND